MAIRVATKSNRSVLRTFYLNINPLKILNHNPDLAVETKSIDWSILDYLHGPLSQKFIQIYSIHMILI